MVWMFHQIWELEVLYCSTVNEHQPNMDHLVVIFNDCGKPKDFNETMQWNPLPIETEGSPAIFL